MIKKVELFGTTDVGQVRDHNEDNFAICKDLSQNQWAFKRDEVFDLSAKGCLLVVADGMGGTNAGEVASHLAQETVQKFFDEIKEIPTTTDEREKLLKKAIVQAHNELVKHQHSNLDTAGMGTTLVIAWVINDLVHIGWSGDSRAYIYQGQKSLLPFTDDHSLVWQMVQQGQMTAEEARVHPESNIITQSLGTENAPPKPSAKSHKIYHGDRIMVCSDGLNGMLSDQEILNLVRLEQSNAEICKELVASANRAGGTDNITVLMLEVKEGPKRPVIKEPISQPKPSPASAPSNTQILRKKNSNKNIIIAVLAVIIAAVIIWSVWPNDKKDRTQKLLDNHNVSFEKGEELKLNLAEMLLENAAVDLDSAVAIYNGKRLNGKNAIVKLTPDTAQNSKLLVRLYPKGDDKFYVSTISLKLKKTEKVAEPNNIAPSNASQNQAQNDENTNQEEGAENEEAAEPNVVDEQESDSTKTEGTNSATPPTLGTGNNGAGNTNNGRLTPINSEVKPPKEGETEGEEPGEEDPKLEEKSEEERPGKKEEESEEEK